MSNEHFTSASAGHEKNKSECATEKPDCKRFKSTVQVLVIKRVVEGFSRNCEELFCYLHFGINRLYTKSI